MSDDNNIYPRFHKRWHRRRKSVQGKDWTPPTVQNVNAGVWCPACRVRHPYNGHGRLLARYEKRGACWVLMWLCPTRGDVVGEIWLGGRT